MKTSTSIEASEKRVEASRSEFKVKPSKSSSKSIVKKKQRVKKGRVSKKAKK